MLLGMPDSEAWSQLSLRVDGRPWVEEGHLAGRRAGAKPALAADRRRER
jgi:hypothetical protein